MNNESKKPNPAEKHHTVPKLYLKRFAKDGIFIECTKLGEPQIREKISIKQASVIRKFYDIPKEMVEEDGLSPDNFEKWLDTNIENPTSAVLDKITENHIWPLSQEDRSTLAIFIAAQFLRTEQVREIYHYIDNETMTIELLKSGKESIQSILKEEYFTLIEDNQIDSTWQLLLQGKFRKDRIPLNNIRLIDENLHKFASYIFERHWKLCVFGDKNIITSDSPVYLSPRITKEVNNEGKEVFISLPSGIKDAPQIIIPLSRNIGLVLMEGDNSFDEVLYGNDDLHEYFIALTINNAYKEVYCHPDDSHLVPKNIPSKIWNPFESPNS